MNLNSFLPLESPSLSLINSLPLKIRKRSITVLPGCSWNRYYQRPQALVVGLAQMLPDWDFYFVSDDCIDTAIRAQAPNVFIVATPWFQQFFDELKQGVFYTTWPMMLPLLKQARVAWFDCVDHPSVHGGDKPGLLQGVLVEMARHENGIVSCISERIKTELLKLETAHVWHNACWPRNFHLPACDKDEPVVIGFWGMLGPWCDEAMLKALAKKYPLRLASENTRDIGRCIGYLDYSRLKAFANICTHLIIPFEHDSPITRYAVPLKQFEYLYTNRRIIRPASIEEISESIWDIKYSDSGAAAIEEIADGIEDRRQITSFNDLDKYSWEQVCRKIVEEIF